MSGAGERSAIAPGVSTPRNRGRKRFLVLAALVLFAVGGVYSWNWISLQSPMNEVIENDSRNAGIEMSVRYRHYVDPSTIVIDVTAIEGEHSKADLFRILLQYAAKMQSSTFDTVVFASHGVDRFMLDGSHFKTIGVEYGSQNPIYTMRTFPAHLRTMNGDQAFGEWTGGLLGVAAKQMEDFSTFIDQWLGG